MNSKEYDTPKGKAVFDYDDNGVGQITLECMDMLMDMVASSMWIPCSERLPDEDGEYLVTQKNGSIGIYVFNSDGNSEEYFKRCATAWMPLPEPWKGANNV